MKLLSEARRPRKVSKCTTLSKSFPHLYSFLVLLLIVFSFTNNVYASGASRPDLGDSVIDGTTDQTGDNAPSTGGDTTAGGGTSTGGGGSAPYGTDFSSPWKNANSAIVIDAYEGNSIDWDKMATDKKVVGVIHRSSIGSRVDSLYKSRKAIALSRGYLWGAYHLGLPGNTIAQAELFLSLVKDEPNTLMVLDLEDTGNGKFMSVDEAVTFMEYVYEKTGSIPTVYANQATTIALNSKVKNNPRFQQSKLWYARFKATVSDFPNGIWKGYFLWQFSSELNCTTTGSCLYNVPGTKFDMDVNVFDGTPAELEAAWNNN